MAQYNAGTIDDATIAILESGRDKNYSIPNTSGKKRRGGFARWLPTALGVGATLAAAPLTGGASLAGTAAILGGAAAAGSGLGEFGAQKLSGEKTDFGKIGKEAAISGVTGAIPIGGAAKAAKVARTSQVAKEAGEEVVKKGIRGKVARAGKEMIASTEGTATGAVIKGGRRVTPKLESEMSGYLKEIGAKGAPKDKLIQVAADKEATGQRIASLVQSADAPVSVGDISRITGKVKKAGITAKNVNTETTTAYRSAIGNAKTKKELQSIKGELDDELASFYKRVDAGTATKAEERVLKGYRDGINDVLKDIPGYAEANKRYVTAIATEDQLLRAPKSSNVRILGVDTGVGGKGIQKGKDTMGRIMQGDVPPVPGMGSGITSKVLREGVKQEIGGGIIDSMVAAPEEPVQETDSMGMDITSDMPQTPTLSEGAQIKENIKKAALQALASGDTKGLESIEKTAALLESMGVFKEAADEKPLSATAAESIAGANAGLEGIQLLRDEMMKNPNVRAKTAIPGRGLIGGVGNRLLGTSNYQAAVGNILDSWARIKTGAAISNTEEARFQANLPEAFDPPETVEKKLKIIENLFTSVANRTGNAGTDLEDLQGGL